MNLDLYGFLEERKKDLLLKRKTVLKIKVKASAKQTLLKELRSDLETVSINLKSPAVNGQANEELKENLAEFFGVSKKMVEIKSGEKSPFKLVFITMD